MREILIKNAQLVNEGEVSQKDLLIRGEKIEKISNHLTPTGIEEVIDASGLHLLPGWIDDQVHFREPGLTHKASIASSLERQLQGDYLLYWDAQHQSQTTTQKALEDKLDRAAKVSIANYGFLFGPLTTGNQDFWYQPSGRTEIIFGILYRQYVGGRWAGITKDFFNDLPIAVHCEDENTIRKNLAEHIDQYGDDISVEKLKIKWESCHSSSGYSIITATGALHVFHLSDHWNRIVFNEKPLSENTSWLCSSSLVFGKTMLEALDQMDP